MTTKPKPTAPDGYRVTSYAVPTRKNCDAWVYDAESDVCTWEDMPFGPYRYFDGGKRWLLRKIPAPVGLCHRCEHRAAYHETGHGPRFECGGAWSVCSCYMYTPCKVVVLKRNTGDKRSVAAGTMVRARSHGVRLEDWPVCVRNGKRGEYWMERVKT